MLSIHHLSGSTSRWSYNPTGDITQPLPSFRRKKVTITTCYSGRFTQHPKDGAAQSFYIEGWDCSSISHGLLTPSRLAKPQDIGRHSRL
jgi:hypothetical protein